MIVHIDNQTETFIPLSDRYLEKTVETVMQSTGWDTLEPYEVSVLFTDKKKIRQMNRDYRNINKATDVISFSFREGKGVEFAGMILGDLVICPEMVKKHSVTYGVDFKTEMTFVVVHGILHILGFDHVKKNDRKKMREMEDFVMRKLLDDGWRGRGED